jgi:hypothetical protein
VRCQQSKKAGKAVRKNGFFIGAAAVCCKQLFRLMVAM